MECETDSVVVCNQSAQQKQSQTEEKLHREIRTLRSQTVRAGRGMNGM